MTAVDQSEVPGYTAVRKTRPGAGIELQAIAPLREPEKGEVLVRVQYAGICGTDLHVDDWQVPYHFMEKYLPVTLGHEFSGTIEQAGPHAASFRPGDRVVVRPSVTCGLCESCILGRFDSCETRRGLGLTLNGAFAPLVLAPARNCIAIPHALSSDLAALAEPFTIAWQAMARAKRSMQVKTLAGQRLLVLGPGIIGQAIALLAQYEGASVGIVGKDDAKRCELLRGIGFTDVLDLAIPAEEEAFQKWDGFTAIFEATGAPESIQHSIGKLKREGVVVVTGIHARALQLDLTPLVRNQQSLVGSFRPPEHAWAIVLTLLVHLRDKVTPLITHRLPLSQAQHAFDLAHDRSAGKVLLMPQGDAR